MAPTPEPSAAPKLPASADFNAIFNSISLAGAKHQRFLSSVRAKHHSLARPTASSETSTSVAITKGAFSSLTKPTSSPTPSTTISSKRARGTGDDSDLRFENPSAGIGYNSPMSEEKDSAVTRDLSRRLLGKRGREVHNKAATQKRRIQEEESEEEEGRSGLGRKKKKRARVEADADEMEVEGSYPGAVRNHEGGNAHVDVSESKPDASPVSGDQPQHDAAGEDTAPPSEATTTLKGEAKKKKNQKNRKKTKANGGAEV
ncbi:hypothetical protein CkaCkLH20_12024 [Colletotrichum karsti]|uniref:Uncharacterized protein n=1 Tax=Colletotrichum karsti TaxID=1095194 RepID=A0A9P6HUH9_9PEZI|nr:uncharacterized protein CkaCkLH20_12024 [Colletotrichum karsti]KAF9870534.1 hypothetical protein CkaCkLH20_12024 [Colletotrichum karsti]